MTVAAVLLFAGVVLLVAEAYLPTSGVLGAVGLAGCLAGTWLLLTGLGVASELAILILLLIATVVGALLVMAAGLALRASRRRARCGAEGLLGHVGVVRSPLDPVGQVAIGGELWRARRSWAEADDGAPGQGEPVVVDHVSGLTLSVRRAEIWELEP
jgi:membrane-bound serine protease (ClpP class)